MNRNKKKPAATPKRVAELNLMIRTAALTVSKTGSVSVLAEECGLKGPGIMTAIKRGYFTAGQACALELRFGAKLLPKEILCPQKFSK